jgi:hypothetical protein
MPVSELVIDDEELERLKEQPHRVADAVGATALLAQHRA